MRILKDNFLTQFMIFSFTLAGLLDKTAAPISNMHKVIKIKGMNILKTAKTSPIILSIGERSLQKVSIVSKIMCPPK